MYLVLLEAVNPADTRQPLFLLYDTVPILKNIRNNWLTRANKDLVVYLALDRPSVCAKWNDQVEIENSRQHIVRPTALSLVACNLSFLERQKMKLILDVSNEKAVAARCVNGHSDTAKFVERVTDLYKVVNVKSLKSCILLNYSQFGEFRLSTGLCSHDGPHAWWTRCSSTSITDYRDA